MTITRQTMRADGITIGQSLDRDAAFLRSIGIDANDGAATVFERRMEQREKVRAAVLAALDEALDGKGWTDQELPALFGAIDQISDRISTEKEIGV